MKIKKQAYTFLIILMLIAFVCMHDESWILMRKLHIVSQEQYLYQIISECLYFFICVCIDYSSLKVIPNLLANKTIESMLSRIGKLILKIFANIEPLCTYIFKKDSNADDAKEAIKAGNNNYNVLLKENEDMLSFYGIITILFIIFIIIGQLNTKYQESISKVIALLFNILNLSIFICVNYKNAKKTNFDLTSIPKDC